MMKEKVYLDSTIFSFYCDGRAGQGSWIEATQRWWHEERPHYDCWTSQAVILEIQRDTYPTQEKVVHLASQVPLLEPLREVETVASYYVQNYLMPSDLLGDAIHLAYASYLGFDYLLTWNCNHLANANKRKHIRVLNGRLGISVPEIGKRPNNC